MPGTLGKRSVRGFTLIEFILVTGLVMVAATLAFQEKMDDLDRRVMMSAGQSVTTIGQAAFGYLSNNQATLAAAAYTDVTLAQLQTVGSCGAGKACLASNFATTNAWGSSYTIRFRRIGGAAPYTFQGLVLTTTPYTKGGVVRLDLLGDAVVTVGTAGGMVEAVDGGALMVRGYEGAWTATSAQFNNIALANGQLAYLVDNSLLGIYDGLYLRTDGGNQMMASLNVGNNAVSNAQTVALTQVNTIGNACSTNGVVSRDATGAVLSCQGGAWQPQGSAYWKDSVATFAALPACNAASSGQTRTVMTPAVGSGPRPYTCDGAGWRALSIDNNGHFTLPGVLYTNGSNSTYGALTIQGSRSGWSGINFKDASGSNSGTLMMHPGYSGFYSTADNDWRWLNYNNGNTYQPGDMNSASVTTTTITASSRIGGSILRPSLMVADSSSCAGYSQGDMAQSNVTAGLILSCQYDGSAWVWKKAAGGGDGTGITGVLAPMKGKTISCPMAPGYIAYAYVDANGYPYARITRWDGAEDTGWVAGLSYADNHGMQIYTASMDNLRLNGLAVDMWGNFLGSCSANWPMT